MRGGRILFTTRTFVVVCDLGFALVASFGFDRTIDIGFAFMTLFVLLSTRAACDFACIELFALRDAIFAFVLAFDLDLLLVFAIISFLDSI